jgi:DNA-binding ferritin-like protein
MSTTTLKQPATKGITVSNAEIGAFLGKVFSFNSSLKLFHWHVTGVSSYAKHIALDQAIGDLLDVTDRLVETTYAMAGDVNIVIPETKCPADIVKHASDFYAEVEKAREFFTEAFTQAIIDDYHEGIQQLLYRLKRLQ